MQRDAEAEDKLLVQRKGRVALAPRARRHTQRGWTADVVCCAEAFSAPASPDADQPMALRRAPDTFPNLQKTEYIPHTQHSPDSSTSSPTPPTLLRHQIWVASVPHICNQVSGVLRKRGRRRYAENMANTVLFGCCSWVFEGDAVVRARTHAHARWGGWVGAGWAGCVAVAEREGELAANQRR